MPNDTLETIDQIENIENSNIINEKSINNDLEFVLFNN